MPITADKSDDDAAVEPDNPGHVSHERVKTNLKTNTRSHVVLFSSVLELSFETIIDYYKLRFQIEFNFRDAKQF